MHGLQEIVVQNYNFVLEITRFFMKEILSTCAVWNSLAFWGRYKKLSKQSGSLVCSLWCSQRLLQQTFVYDTDSWTTTSHRRVCSDAVQRLTSLNIQSNCTKYWLKQGIRVFTLSGSRSSPLGSITLNPCPGEPMPYFKGIDCSKCTADLNVVPSRSL